MRHALLPIVAVALGVSGAAAWAPTAADSPEARLRDLFDREWRWRLQEDPLLATSVGVHEFGDRLPAESLADQERRAEATRRFLEELRSIDRARLAWPEQVNHDVFARQLQDRLAEREFSRDLIPLNADSGFHSSFARLPETVPLGTVRDYDNYVARLRAFPRYMDEHIGLMREGLRRGLTQPRVVLAGIEGTIRAHVVEAPEKSVFWKPFAGFPASVPAPEQARLREAGKAAILQGVVPAYDRFAQFMTREYLPGARETLGASALPSGAASYAQLVRHFTTLDDMDPERVHRLGLGEVQRIQAEMDAVIAQVGFKGDFAAFLSFLRTDRRFYATSPEQLLKEAAYIAKRMDARLPSLFKTLPRLPYGVAPVPEHIAPKYTAGRYVSPPFGSTQPGYYWVNTYAVASRPLYNLEALTLHEAVPGHHLQNALAMELGDLPPFRRFSYLSAFGEGWGLYSERLGLEAGFYTDPYSNFGRLTYEMWRACRLVVDTGLHAKGWTRQQAIDYLASRTALPLHEVQTETDRYISWPAQALSYKIGELKIRELRKRAEDRLGPRFDVREFHDAVLLNGSVPLGVLEQAVDRYIAQAASRP